MKNKFWIIALIFFLILIIPYFQNINQPMMKFFFATPASLNDVYFPVLFLGMVEGILIYLSIQKLVKTTTQKKPEKFDLN